MHPTRPITQRISLPSDGSQVRLIIIRLFIRYCDLNLFVAGNVAHSSSDMARVFVEVQPQRHHNIGLLDSVNLIANGDAESGTVGSAPPGWSMCTYAVGTSAGQCGTATTCTLAQSTCTNGDNCPQSGWKVSSTSSDVRSGSKAYVNKCGSGYFNYIQQTITTYTVGTYTLSFWVKINSAGASWYMTSGPNSAPSSLQLASGGFSTTYSQYSYSFTATSTQTIIFFAGSGDGGPAAKLVISFSLLIWMF